MAADDDSTPIHDDRWSAFKDPCKSATLGAKPEEDPGPDLSEYIEKVIEQRSPRKQHERMYKMVSHLVRLVTGLAWSLTSEWKHFLQTNKKNEIRTTPVRSLTVDHYECMVPLMRSLKPDAFKFVQRGHEEMLPHHYYIQVNPNLSKEEGLLVRSEWGPHISKHGYLMTSRVLDWFNKGVVKACSILMTESKNITVLRCETMHDGTIMVHSTISNSIKDDAIGKECFTKGNLNADVFSINIYPVFTVHSLSLVNLSVSSPMPVSGTSVYAQRNLKQSLLKGLDDGEQLIFLQPKKHVPSTSPIKCSLPPDGKLWRLNLSYAEEHVFQIMDTHCRGIDFRQVLVLMEIMREQYLSELRILNNDILVNTMFVTSKKEYSRMTVLHDWFFQVLKAICKGLKSGFLPSFFLPRQNLLVCYCTPEADMKVALKKLEDILKSTKENPKNILEFTDYTEQKRIKPDNDSSEDDADSQPNKSNAEEDSNDIEEDNNDIIVEIGE